MPRRAAACLVALALAGCVGEAAPPESLAEPLAFAGTWACGAHAALPFGAATR